MSLFVMPIAIAGLDILPEGSNPDLFVLTVPLRMPASVQVGWKRRIDWFTLSLLRRIIPSEGQDASLAWTIPPAPLQDTLQQPKIRLANRFPPT